MMELIGSAELRNLLLLVITICVILISIRLVQFLNHMIEKAKFEKDIALRSNMARFAKDLIVTAEKRFSDEPQKREKWVIDMLKYHFSNEIKNKPEFDEEELLALVQKNYESLKTEIPEKRWEKIHKTAPGKKTKKK